ncbi:UDP-galactopyranose mutase [Streptomyces sp. TRM68367]|uniref:UDP-galactopyranose mutase n=1 Tax=Streptomyces sp. TRM68367 TaxID=2758415 RepID=UPI0037DCEBCF
MRYTYDNNYFDDTHQALLPPHGYHHWLRRMADHENIRVLLDTDFFDVHDGLPHGAPVVCAGPLDRYFGPAPQTGAEKSARCSSGDVSARTPTWTCTFLRCTSPSAQNSQVPNSSVPSTWASHSAASRGPFPPPAGPTCASEPGCVARYRQLFPSTEKAPYPHSSRRRCPPPAAAI